METLFLMDSFIWDAFVHIVSFGNEWKFTRVECYERFSRDCCVIQSQNFHQWIKPLLDFNLTWARISFISNENVSIHSFKYIWKIYLDFECKLGWYCSFNESENANNKIIFWQTIDEMPFNSLPVQFISFWDIYSLYFHQSRVGKIGSFNFFREMKMIELHNGWFFWG